MKGFTSIKTLGRSELRSLVERASAIRDALTDDIDADPALAGSVVALAFFEPSTRTRLSFDLAAQRLGAHVLTLDPPNSSTVKGESLRDTCQTVAAIGADILVVRHSDSGACDAVAGWTGLPVVNAGDGSNEHPTQALLDLVTIQRHFGECDGLRVAIVGDVTHSRVAGSVIPAMTTLGMDITLVGPDSLLPPDTTHRTSTDFDRILGDVDIVYLLRVQTERGGRVDDDYTVRYQLDRRRSAALAEHAVVMHPGPMNRGIEIAEDVADSPRSLVVEQVRNGVPSRMAVLEMLGIGT